MAYSTANGNNTFIPSHEATGHMLVGFSRNIKTFPINRYAKYVPVKKREGRYLRWASQQAARVVDSTGARFTWADGADRPHGKDNLEQFTFDSYATERLAFSYSLGQMAIDQADWQILALHGAMAAQQCMTDRTLQAISALTNATWGSNTAATIGGQLSAGKTWYNGDDNSISSPKGPNIKNSLALASLTVNKSTIGTIQPKDLVLVINPNTARQMASTNEIHTYIARSPFALAQIKGDVESQNGAWGLPDVLYGHPVVIEDTVQITSKVFNPFTTSPTNGYALPDDVAFLLSRPEGLDGIDGVPQVSTLTAFFYEEMTVESKYDPDHRRTLGSVVTDYDVVTTSPLGGFYFQSVAS